MKFSTTPLRFLMTLSAAVVLLLAWFPSPTEGAVPGGTGNRIDFEDIPAGNAILAIGPDITIRAQMEPFDFFANPLLPSAPVCFDSSKPGSGDTQTALGSPNSFGGPGIGPGGMVNTPYANNKSHGKLLVISGNNAAVNNPFANLWGGVLTITFRIPVNIDSFGLIMGQTHRNNVDAYTADGKTHSLQFYGKYFNSYWLVPVKIPNVLQLVFKPQSIVGITHINFAPEPSSCPITRTLEFDNLKVGALVTTIAEGITVVSTKESKGDKQTGALVIDTARPGADNLDFGAPHESAGGPGWGPDGRKGLPFANVAKQGNALTACIDPSNARPSPARGGGTMIFTFDPPVYLASIGLLNNVQGVHMRVVILYNNQVWHEEYTTNVGGRNSFQELFLWQRATTELQVTFNGPGAITFIKLGTCKS